MNNPFDWQNYKPIVSMKDMEKVRLGAYHAARAVNEKRKRGVEPSLPYAGSPGGVPQDYTVNMPNIPLTRPNRRRK